jgi:hypothetical protein
MVQEPLRGGETVWKKFLSCHTIGIGIDGYLPFIASAPLGVVLPNAPSCTTIWQFEELKGRSPLKPVKIV